LGHKVADNDNPVVQPEVQPTPKPSLAEAETILENLVRGLSMGQDAFTKPNASNLRALLIGRDASCSATWEELYLFKLMYALPQQSYMFNLRTGTSEQGTSEPCSDPEQELVQDLSTSILMLLNEDYYSADQINRTESASPTII